MNNIDINEIDLDKTSENLKNIAINDLLIIKLNDADQNIITRKKFDLINEKKNLMDYEKIKFNDAHSYNKDCNFAWGAETKVINGEAITDPTRRKNYYKYDAINNKIIKIPGSIPAPLRWEDVVSDLSLMKPIMYNRQNRDYSFQMRSLKTLQNSCVQSKNNIIVGIVNPKHTNDSAFIIFAHANMLGKYKGSVYSSKGAAPL